MMSKHTSALVCALAAVLLAATAGASGEGVLSETIATCAVCHGENGASAQPLFPILAGQEQYYLYVQLKDLKSGLREGPVMGPIAAALEKEEMLAIAEHFSEQQWPDIGHQAAEGSEAVALRAINAGQCVACHLSGFEGNSRVPRLAGQHAEYLAKTMLDFKHRLRRNAPDKASLLATFTEEDIRGLADYLAGLRVTTSD